MEVCKAALVVLGIVAVPTTAFLLRMLLGDTRNPDEELIAKVVRDMYDRMSPKKETA